MPYREQGNGAVDRTAVDLNSFVDWTAVVRRERPASESSSGLVVYGLTDIMTAARQDDNLQAGAHMLSADVTPLTIGVSVFRTAAGSQAGSRLVAR
ncbi:MAG TPA: hypothetical protein VF594_11600 [Rubricoccaceae bacterium]